jgi:aldehyde:ferredoxin oxidoreductase
MPTHTGKILDIDLSSGKISTTTVEDDVVRKYIGGSGMAAKLFLDRVSPDVDPMSNDNVLFLMGGPLAGTGIPGSSRFTVSCKSPLTGIWGEGAGGGNFAPALKRAGYDGIAITGASDKPVHISIKDDKVEILDASDLWGKDVYETVDALTAGAEGKNKPRILCIGPAGENLVKFSAVANGKDAFAARTGGGTVMGSKKLKAISVLGTGKVEAASPEELKTLRKDATKKVNENIIAQSLGAMGTNMGMDVGGMLGDIPTKNYSLGDPGEIAIKVGGGVMTQQYLTRPDACEACPIGCKRVVKVDEGPFQVKEGPGPEYETAAAFGPLLMNDNMPAVLKLSELANKYGVDSISCGASIAFAMECFEKGVITSDDLDGDSLRWGNVDDIFAMLDKIVFRKGFGDVLAEGTRAAAKKIGKDSADFTCEVKGLDSPMHDGRALHGIGLAYAMSNRGACHLQHLDLALESNWCAYPEVGLDGGYVGMSSEGKADVVHKCENLGMLTNAAIICQFNFFALTVNDLLDMMKYSTGFDYDLDELMACGERIWVLKRGLNNLMGVTQADDRLPKRMMTAFTEGGAAGSLPDMELMLKEYYPLRGLDAQGRPSKEKLDSLGLTELAAKLY